MCSDILVYDWNWHCFQLKEYQGLLCIWLDKYQKLNKEVLVFINAKKLLIACCNIDVICLLLDHSLG